MRNIFPIVGIGSSAGGLEALEILFRGMPADTGMSFVLVSHLARGHESSMVEIVGRFCAMPVKRAADGYELRPNEVVVSPPDHVMTLADGRLRLQQRFDDTQRKPIDVFLSALAEQHGDAAVGILLSGGGTDGTLGIKAIRERGGLTMAQGSDGTAPMQSSMPDTAISAGVVDLVLPVEQMAQRLVKYAGDFGSGDIVIDDAERASNDDASRRAGYQAIYRLLRDHVGHDFSGYKEKSFQRRVRHRMQVLQITALRRYVARLRNDPAEVSALFRDLLIGVTTFFRDPDAFEALEKTVIPRLFEGKGLSDTIRVWVPGCATGEEVYSVAILLREHMDSLRASPKVQVFATDIDEPALAVARSGRYPQPLLDNVSKMRLRRFFTGDDVSYAVNKEIRDMCIFSAHSVIRDPPFSRIDLISCRNLLIYFGTEFQAQVVPVFHFALKPRGYLFLGTAENVSQFSDLFTAVEKKQRIFQRRDHVTSPMQFPSFTPMGRTAPASGEMRRSPGGMAANLRHTVETRVLERFAPAHVVVTREGDIIHYSSRTGKYLEPAAGLPNRQLIAMARRGLRLDLRNALREAIQTRRMVTRERIAVELDDRLQFVNIMVEPLGDNDQDPAFLVLFDDVGSPVPPSELGAKANNPRDRTAEHLEQELRETRDRLQATIEEYESAVEELKSSNEELQSMNEELQSTNEELETSKEELQSVNEELQTVNSELNAKVDEVDRANSDLRNVFDSTQIATIFLDHNLVIRSFTPAVAGIFNLISSDRGRPLTDIVHHLADTGDLKRDIQSVLEHGNPVEKRVRRDDSAAHYLMRILPYRGRNNVIDGVLVTFVNVTNIVEAEAHQRTLVEELNHRVRNMLTVVGAIANQTLAKSESPENFADAFLGRLHAMGKSYDLVSREHWGEVPLREILTNELGSHKGEHGERAALEGPEVLFAPAKALGLGLVFHELVTNAVKYGALSGTEGRVAVSWAIEKGRLTITWVERGGPKPGKTSRKGFGTELIERELKSVLRGRATFEYGEAGIEVRISIPVEDKHE
ncbi:MAG TPA: CheR family methyltransferase [Pseudolabrys sp.]|nr:CheR family methyltransferase [Pseudolabrys sp.]